ncbi:hypothetical protein [Roseateles depolymerans]|uniref:Uncharacterized protein n=1 Tax=Roseateles depolymerans TaxID=76731 RepID=A0A0U3N4E5_9BURK|nr:hypothetical protein [Roseateles depolymerans]ALV07083.1 hypothetical protein RD2015_2618 [Roseateles depolymerans]REG20066.1 hypothetical protein DES44_2572 [Roseateles depolymerans]
MTQPLPGRTRIQDVVINGVRIDRVLNIDAQASKACAALWATGEFTQLHIGSYENPGLDRLDALDDFSGVTRLHVMLDHRVDVSPLKKHASTLVAYLCNDELNPLVDASEFRSLQSLSQPWDARLDLGEGPSALRRLFLDRYAPAAKDLSALPAAPQLQELGLLRSSVTSLAHVGRFPELQKLRLTMSRSLVSVNELSVCRGLKDLEIDGAKKIQDLDTTLPDCTGLEKLVLMKVADLRDLGFVAKMPDLRWLNLMDTSVVDGDMTPLIEHPRLEYVVFTSKKHFSHTEAQVRALRKSRSAP